MHERGIPGGGQSDGLREDGGLPGARDAVERFVPPVVGGDVEAGDGRRGVLHLEDLLLQGHAADEIGGAAFGGEVGIEVRSLREGSGGKRQEEDGLGHSASCYNAAGRDSLGHGCNPAIFCFHLGGRAPIDCGSRQETNPHFGRHRLSGSCDCGGRDGARSRSHHLQSRQDAHRECSPKWSRHCSGIAIPDKGEGLNSLRNRKWDAVIDNSGYFPRLVSASAKLLAPSAEQYIFISSISVYADNSDGEPGRNRETGHHQGDDRREDHRRFIRTAEGALREGVGGGVPRAGDHRAARIHRGAGRSQRTIHLLAGAHGSRRRSAGSRRAVGPDTDHRRARPGRVAGDADRGQDGGHVQRGGPEGPLGVGRSGEGVQQGHDEQPFGDLGAGGMGP